MARYVAIMRDSKAAADARSTHSEAHLAYLQKNKGKILLAGALRSEDAEGYIGALWIFEAKDANEVVSIIKGDPYYALGLRGSYEIALWGKPSFFGDVLL